MFNNIGAVLPLIQGEKLPGRMAGIDMPNRGTGPALNDPPPARDHVVDRYMVAMVAVRFASPRRR
jgi:hypothetical protein